MGSKRTKKKSKKQQEEIFCKDCDQNSAFIEGYTFLGVSCSIIMDEI